MKLTPNTKKITLPNGLKVTIAHYCMGDRMEYHATAWDGERMAGETYAQYINGYPGAYSWVCGSRLEAFARIKKWVERL